MRLWKIAGLSSFIAVVGISCGDNTPPEEIGEAQIALVEVPAGVSCIRLSAAGSRVVQKTFMPLFTNQDSVLRMEGLPTGSVSFTGEAFMQACNMIAGATPNWKGGPVVAQVMTGTVAQVTIVMKRNGQANVGVDFDDPMCSIAGDMCTADAMCCGGPNLTASCQAGLCAATCTGAFSDCNSNIPLDGCETNIASDINNCGACGFLCPFACLNGICINSTLAVGGNTFQGIRIFQGSTTTDATGITATIVFGGLCDVADPAWAGQIVLCQRGNITFTDKEQNVESVGGLAAVVFNSPGAGLFTGILLQPANIPVVGISGSDGQFIVANNLGQTATLISPP